MTLMEQRLEAAARRVVTAFSDPQVEDGWNGMLSSGEVEALTKLREILEREYPSEGLLPFGTARRGPTVEQPHHRPHGRKLQAGETFSRGPH